MELEKLKEIWTSLDERMQQQEGLKTAIIKEMLFNKSDKALSRLINYSYFGVIFGIVVLPVLIWGWTLSSAAMSRIVVPIVALFILFYIIVMVIQLLKLYKVNFSNPIKDNNSIVNEIVIFNKRALIITNIAGFMLFIPVIIVTLMTISNVEPWRMGALIAALFIGAIGAVWEYKRVYKRNFDTILKSLEELKELEEPDDI